MLLLQKMLVFSFDTKSKHYAVPQAPITFTVSVLSARKHPQKPPSLNTIIRNARIYYFRFFPDISSFFFYSFNTFICRQKTKITLCASNTVFLKVFLPSYAPAHLVTQVFIMVYA